MNDYTLRDKALSLPVNHPARIIYRNYVRGQANAREEVAITTNSAHGHLIGDNANRHYEEVENAVEQAIAGVTLYQFTPSGARCK